MADRNALGMIGLLFGATTLFVMMMGAVVVADHLSGKLHIEDGPSQLEQVMPAAIQAGVAR
jgi:predicted peroxiredoxin